MAKTKDNLKDMKGGELEKKLAILQENVRVIRFKAEGSKSKNVKELGTLKKDIARILTEMKRAKGQLVKKQ
ncbi:MAG TPA: 50S ribosomal protein L29 [Candidatus Paceibacterota bacterium]|jgi:ribosomal protein L29|nr:50S ribosomal protein L29 [Candidatus Paceibacterota bacterium]